MFLDSSRSFRIHWGEVCSMGLEVDYVTPLLNGRPLTVIWEHCIQPLLVSDGFKSTFIVPVTGSLQPSTKLKPDVMMLDVKSVQGW